MRVARLATTARQCAAAFLLLAGCTAQPEGSTVGVDTMPADTGQGSTGSTGGGSTSTAVPGDTGSTSSGGSSGAPADTTGSDPIFDVGAPETTTGDETGCFGERCMCSFPAHVPCDANTNDPFEAIGLNCPGEPQVNGGIDAAPVAHGLRSSFGANATFDPREGSVYLVLSTGDIAELDDETPQADSNMNPTYCNTDVGNYDPGDTLPAPLDPTDVGAMDCIDDPTLVGTGDCSNSIQGQFEQGMSAEDYAELRFSMTVPIDVEAFQFDFAFFSVEWPFYDGSQFNDLFVGWLESETWTGNISFDAMGNPISLNASFFQLKDNGGNLPEFDGTCMRKHGGSGWLSTAATVTPEEDITMVFAIFDMSDSILDSFVFIDNWQWGCVPTGGPVTEPAG